MISRSVWWRTVLLAAAIFVLPAAPLPAFAASTPPPDTSVSGAAPAATNDLLPQNNDLGNCIGTAESANCGSKARADGHTYLVFGVLVVGLGFIMWRISKGVRAREGNDPAAEDHPTTVTR